MRRIPKAIRGEWRDLARRFLLDPRNSIVLTKNNHAKWITPMGVSISGTSVSDRKAIKNHEKHLRQIGWEG